jgi:nucleoside-diphosphate-sugar epimerase
MKTKTDQVGGKVLVTGAGGFIGHHLVKFLKSKGLWVRGVDIKKPEYEPSPADEFLVQDLRLSENADRAVRGIREVYQLGADMGGIGYITRNFAALSRNNALVNVNMLEASHNEGVERYLYTSSACVYPSFLQHVESVKGLREEDAIPADPEKGYGWEKLFAEQLTSYYGEDYGLGVHVVRLHNIYGPLGAYKGGKEKAPAAICRKVAEAADGSTIEVWGDGEQTRSFCYVGDCVEGLVRIMGTDDRKPFNLGTEDLVTINELVDLVTRIAGKRLRKEYDASKPQGVRGRNSDNSRLRRVLNWEPKTRLEDGLRDTYPWIWSRLDERGLAKPPRPNEAVVRPPIPR